MKTKAHLVWALAFLPFYLFGQIAFEKSFGTPSNFDGISASVPTLDGNYLSVGTTATLGADNHGVLIHKFSPEGNLIFIKTWDDGGHDSANDIIPLSTGEFIATGYSHDLEKQQLLVLKLNEIGEEVWHIKIKKQI